MHFNANENFIIFLLWTLGSKKRRSKRIEPVLIKGNLQVDGGTAWSRDSLSLSLSSLSE